MNYFLKNEKIHDTTTLNFIKEFPNAYNIKNKRVDALAHNMANTNGRRINFYKRKANIIKEYASNSYPSVDESSMDVQNLKQLCEILIELTKQKDLIKHNMIELARDLKCLNQLTLYWVLVTLQPLY